MGNILSISLYSPQDMMLIISEKFKNRRLSLNLKREGLATRSGVSAGSIKRFETTGKISLESLLKIALPLECLDDFEQIVRPPNIQDISFDELLKDKPVRQRGRLQ